MANTYSARKKKRGDERKTAQNDTYRTAVKKKFKSLKRAKTAKTKTEARNELISLIDKSGKRKIFHANKARRLVRKAYTI